MTLSTSLKYLAIKLATHRITVEDIRAALQKYASLWYRAVLYAPFVKDIRVESQNHVLTERFTLMHEQI
ncbi:hypothetical protein N7510_008106 [Penicillium lagena]|uniref:uncharacterized protein n=1 Tax=Penicillium lagena TaxID=94218 RepID=UPI00254223ED|nr:uncharacterized protein N7510_008106 [Penicillium lagena]KAJ5611387.1 hypothetical protein N7510_008106 [Penicillium lagena]